MRIISSLPMFVKSSSAEGVTKKPDGTSDVGWFAYATVDKSIQKPETIRIMAEAGCSRIGIGLESLHRDILKSHKPTHATYKKGVNALKIVNENGILNRTYLMVGWPEETPEMFDATKEILTSGELPIDQLRIAFAVPFLGTPLYEELKSQLITHDWRMYTGDQPVIKNNNMSTEEMKQKVKSMLISYYSSTPYKEHVSGKIADFPYLKESFVYWEEFLHKRGILDKSLKLVE